MAYAGNGTDGLGREIVLGLLAEQPGNCYQLERRLSKRFRSAGYTNGLARHAIKRLVNDGLACASVSPKRAVSIGGSRESKTYTATPAGIEHFRAWMKASVSTPPVREELHAKIALCRPEDLPRMVQIVREAEGVCLGKLQALNFRVRSRRSEIDPEDWWTRMDLIVSTGDQAWWDSRIKWLQQVRIYLEEELRRLEAARPARTEAPRLT
jgi:DNA-binding PadR family transcriptional regulator